MKTSSIVVVLLLSLFVAWQTCEAGSGWVLWLCKGELLASPTCNIAGSFPEKAVCVTDMESHVASLTPPTLTPPKGIRIPITRVSDTEIHYKIQSVTRTWGVAVTAASYVYVCLPETQNPRGR